MKSFLPFLLFLLTACTSSKIVSSWTAPEAGTHPYKKILVAGMVPDVDSSTCRKMELQMVQALKNIGCNAVSFLQTFDKRDFQNIRYDSAHARFRREGIDGILTINLAGKEKEEIYVPGKPANNTLLNKTCPFLENNAVNNDCLNKYGYYVPSIQLFWESRFLDLRSLSLLYHAASTSFDPLPAQRLANQYGKQIVEDLQRSYVLIASGRR